jgi:hypothetical protein
MPYIREKITAGKQKEVKVYHAYKYQSKKTSRSKNIKITAEEMAKINTYNAERKLRILLNANFKENDFYLTLTYQDKTPDAAEAKSYLAKFIRKLRVFYKKLGSVLKYIAVTEYKKKRIHHHMIINANAKIKFPAVGFFGKSDIEILWGHGFCKVELFGGQPEDCKRLASYFIKETNNTFNTDERVHGLRWISSKNLIHPVPETKIVKADTWREDPKADKGYYIDQSSVKTWRTNDGYMCQFYRMIKLDEAGGRKHGKVHTRRDN